MNNVLTGIAFDYINDNRNRYPKVVLARMGRSLELFRAQHSPRLNYLVEGRWRMPSTLGLALYCLCCCHVLALWVLRSQGVRLTVPLSLWAMVLFASATTFGLTISGPSRCDDGGAHWCCGVVVVGPVWRPSTRD